jgi:hypothetical protein
MWHMRGISDENVISHNQACLIELLAHMPAHSKLVRTALYKYVVSQPKIESRINPPSHNQFYYYLNISNPNMSSNNNNNGSKSSMSQSDAQRIQSTQVRAVHGA